MSAMKNVPQLRFGEFSGEWEEKKIGQIGTFFSGGTPTSSNKEYYNGSIPFIGSGKINSKEVAQYITQEALENSSAKIVEVDDLLYALYGATSGAVALSKINGAINQAVLCIRTDMNKVFLMTWLQKNKNRILETYLQGGQGNLSAQIVKSLKLHLPSKQEQEKIASFLSSVDTKIEQLTSKTKLLQEYKKGVMQKIFSQEIRFRDDDGSDYCEWVERKLKDVGNIIGGGTPETNKTEYWGGTIQWFTPTEIKTKYIKSSKRTITELGLKKSSAKILPKGTLLLSSRATIGDISISLQECSTNQGFQSIVVNENNNNEFIYYWILKNKKILLRRSSGSTFLEISKHEISKININLPFLKEQTKIASFLSSIDSKIEQAQKQLDSTKEFKKALLQQMFV